MRRFLAMNWTARDENERPLEPPGAPLPPTPPLAEDNDIQHDGEGGNSFQSDSDTDGYGGFDHAEWNGRYSYTDDEMDQDDGTGVAVDQDDGASQR